MTTDLDWPTPRGADNADSNHRTNPPSGQTVIQQVRELIAAATAAGKPAPGRPTLVRLTGATDHQVRRAMAAVAHDTVDPATVTVTVQSAQHPASPTHLRHHERAGTHTNPNPNATPIAAHQPHLPAHGGDGGEASTASRPPRPWPLLLIGLGAAVAVWSGWVGLGQLTGFGVVQLLPGVWDELRINTAVVLPLSVEAYGGYALRCWLGATGLSARTRRFARRSAITSLIIGAGAQAAYHLMTAAGIHTAPWSPRTPSLGPWTRTDTEAHLWRPSPADACAAYCRPRRHDRE